MKPLITLYPLRPGRATTCPTDKVAYDIAKCYKIDVGYGERTRKNGQNGYVMTEKIATYYIGEIVPEATVKHGNMFGTVPANKRKTEDIFYIKLNDGRYHEILASSQVINPKNVQDIKLVDLFDDEIYLD